MPHQSILWYHLYSAETGYGFGQAPDHTQAISDLRRCIQEDPTNAFLLYLLAYEDMHKSAFENNSHNNSDLADKPGDPLQNRLNFDKQMVSGATSADRSLLDEALFSIETANTAPRCERPMYKEPVPPLIAAAWEYMSWVRILFPEDAHARDLARDLTGYAQGVAANGSLPDAERACRAVIGIGNKWLGNWQVTEDPRSGDTVIDRLVGAAIAAIGYSELVTIYQNFGAATQATSAQTDYDAFKSRVDDFKKSLSTTLMQNMFANY